MKLIPVSVEKDGALRLPHGWPMPPNARLAIVALESNEMAVGEVSLVAERGGSFEFLREEPELYTDADVLPDRRNPEFGGGRGDVQDR